LSRIEWTEQAEADIRKLDKLTALRVLHALHRFAESGDGDIKALQGNVDELRLRIADYRLFFVYTARTVASKSAVSAIGAKRTVIGTLTRSRAQLA
jgi:mRNA-degrading endonuclease RelE of RelBE toxin-antitoxin system